MNKRRKVLLEFYFYLCSKTVVLIALSDADKFMQERFMRDLIRPVVRAFQDENVQISRDKEVGFCFGNIVNPPAAGLPLTATSSSRELRAWLTLETEEK